MKILMNRMIEFYEFGSVKLMNNDDMIDILLL